MKTKCKICQRVVKEGKGFTSSLAQDQVRFCSVECVQKYANKFFRLQERIDKLREI